MAGTAGASLSTALLLAACNGGGEVTATKIATEFAKTQTPIAETATPEPTGTATPEPTRAPAEVAGELDLKSEPLYQGRTFEYEERNGTTYLVDTYNDAPKAVLQEDGTWRKLDYTNNEDAETMYGALVPRDGEYIDPEMHYSGGVPVGRDLRTRFLGDWEVDKVEYKGQEMDMYFLRAGLRDGDGELHVARLALDAPGFMTEHVTYVQCITESGRGPTMGNGWHVSTWTEDLLIQLHPGESLAMFVDEPVWRKPRPFGSQNVVMSGVEYPEFNNAQSVLLSTLYSEQPDQYQLSPAEKAAMGQGKWPDRTATLVMRDILSIYRGSVQECPQYHWR